MDRRHVYIERDAKLTGIMQYIELRKDREWSVSRTIGKLIATKTVERTPISEATYDFNFFRINLRMYYVYHLGVNVHWNVSIK